MENVSFSYGNAGPASKRIIESLSLSVFEGEFLSIIGASGSGKTTILNLIFGLLEPTSGSVTRNLSLDGSQVNVGYMPAHDALFPWRTVEKNVALGLDIAKIAKPQKNKSVQEMLKAVGLSGCEKMYPNELSTGMRQRVAIARTFAPNPNLFLMDEPFSALDGLTRMKMQDLFLGLWERGSSTAVQITHDISEAIRLSDRIIVLSSNPATVLKEITVTLARPRRVDDLMKDGRFSELQSEIFHLLEQDDAVDDPRVANGVEPL